MPDIPVWVQVAGGLIAIISALVGLTVYFTRLRIEGSKQLNTCQLELSEKKSTIAALETSVQALTQSISLLRKGRADAFNILTELNRLISDVRNAIGATADSILIKNPYSDDTLVFLAVHGEAADKIKRMKVPMNNSLAGTVFYSGRLSIVSDQGQTGTSHYARTDQKSGYKSCGILSIPLSVRGETVGVAQFLNKRDGASFSSEDAGKAAELCTDLAHKVKTLASDPDALRLIGVAEVPDDTKGSILFSDITRSSSLFDRMPTGDVIDLVNEYFDRLGSIAIRNGATIDKFLGDGAMYRFNIPRSISDYAVAAIRTALRMQSEFNLLREEWLRLGYPASGIAQRIGVATGPVMGGLMGHSQYLSYTVIGQPVNFADTLCEIARGSESGVVVCSTTFDMARDKVRDFASFAPFETAEGTVYEVRPRER